VSCSLPASAARQPRASGELAARKLPEISALISDLTELRAIIAACLDCGCMDFENCQLLTRPAGASR
jgi:MerR family redox-sensitive transcriptional activator SoxR